MDLGCPGPQNWEVIEKDFFKISKSCPCLQKAVLLLHNGGSMWAIRFYRRIGVEEDWEITKEDVGQRDP
jgi:hypothetical protein